MISKTKIAILSALCCYQVCAAAQGEEETTLTPGTRAHHRQLEGRGPNGECLNFPCKDRLCFVGNTLYVLGLDGGISARNLEKDESFQPTILKCPSKCDASAKLHMLSDTLAVVEARSENKQSIYLISPHEVCELGYDFQHAWVTGVSPDRKYVFFNASGPTNGTQEWVNRVYVHDVRARASTVLPHAPAHSNPYFEGDRLAYWINRSHTGEQSVHVVNPMTSAVEKVYCNTADNVVLVGCCARERIAMEVVYENGHWVPYLSKWAGSTKDRVGSSQVLGDVLHVQYEGADKPIFYSEIFKGGLTRHHLLNAGAESLLVRDVTHVMQVVNGRSIVKGPELNGGISAISSINSFYLIVLNQLGTTHLIEAKRPNAGEPLSVKECALVIPVK